MTGVGSIQDDVGIRTRRAYKMLTVQGQVYLAGAAGLMLVVQGGEFVPISPRSGLARYGCFEWCGPAGLVPAR